MKVSALVCCRNEINNIQGLLDNLLGRVDEIVIVDGMSTDGTFEMCLEYTNKVYQREPSGYCEPDRDFCIRRARNRWCLLMDADERASPFLMEALNFKTNTNHVSAFWIPRRNYYAPDKYYRHIHYPDLQLRLFDKDKITWPTDVHGGAKVEGECVTLREPYYIKHLSPIYGDMKKYRQWAGVHARDYPVSKPAFVYHAAAPLRYVRTMADDMKGGCVLDGLQGLKAAHNHALYDYWVYRLIGRM